MCCINKNTLYKDAIQWERGAAANRAAGCGLHFHCLAGSVSWHSCFRYIWPAWSAWRFLVLQDWCNYCSREVQRINTAENKHQWLCVVFLVIGPNSDMYLRRMWNLKPLSWVFTYSFLFTIIKISPVHGVSCALKGWDGNTCRCRGGGREGRERIASCHQPWFKWYVSESISCWDRRCVFFHICNHSSQAFSKLQALWAAGFFAATSTTSLMPFAWGEACPSWSCQHLPETENWEGIDSLDRLFRGSALLMTWDPSKFSYSLLWEMKQEIPKITKLFQWQSG